MRDLLSAASKTGGAAVISALLMVITTKALAALVGPEGLGLYTVLDQVRLAVVAFATLGGGTALVQGIASKHEQAQQEYLGTTLALFAVGAIIASLLLVALSPWITPLLTQRTDGMTIYLVSALALPVVFNVIYGYLAGVMNGFRSIGNLAVSQVLGALTMAVLAYPVTRLYNAGHPIALVGLMVGAVLVQAGYAFVIANRAGWLAQIRTRAQILFRWASARYFFSISIAMFITSQVSSNVLLAVIGLVSSKSGLAGVGIFNAGWVLSMRYVMLVLTSFTTYYLPSLSGMSTAEERSSLMNRVLRLTGLVVIPLVTTMIVLKPLVITVLYSSDFLEAVKLVRWMLIGDYLKFFNYVIAMPILAYANMRIFLATETLWYAAFLGLSYLSLQAFGSIEGIGVAYLILYTGYIAFYLRYVGRKYAYRPVRREIVLWVCGLALILGVSILFWDQELVSWAPAVVCIAAAGAFSWLSLSKMERAQIFTITRLQLGRLRWAARGR